MIGIDLFGPGCRHDFLVLAHLLGVFGTRRHGKRESPCNGSNKNLEEKRRHGGLRKKSECISLNELRRVRKVNGTSTRSQVGVGIFTRLGCLVPFSPAPIRTDPASDKRKTAMLQTKACW